MVLRAVLSLVLLAIAGCVDDTYELTTELSGRSGDPGTLASGVVVTPGGMDFGLVAASCPSLELEGAVIAVGEGAVTVESAQLTPEGGPFELVPPTSGPIHPGERRRWAVRATPGAVGVVTGTVRFEIRVPGRRLVEVSRPVRLVVADAPSRTDRFVQNTRRATDVLFVIDDSASMAPEQEALGRNFVAFLQAADQGLADYQVAVTTTDMSETGARGIMVPLPPPPQPPEFLPEPRDGEFIVTRSSLPSPTELFRTNALVGIGGALEERGLDAMAAALTEPLASGRNLGFRRPEAALSVIFVSDEDDASDFPVSYYADLLQSLVDDQPSRVSASAIVGPEPAGCSGTTGSATAGARYAALARALGGRVESICTEDWGATLARLSGVAFGLEGRFVLSANPAGDPTVTVDGNPRPRVNQVGQTVWTVDPATRTLEFERGFAPGEGALVEVTYTVGCPDNGPN